ncbi:hypothetical protein M0813_02210 [Anaeramoeba flamelloides]|uniref:Profilin n=1 Tax=Anaeramoeba flamelloides TaxID=1746091 RepID=A0ABQ8YQS1_9EUKA|nr:hypothetical protein M0813_02210 [Anaeramoeba flamelloides]
MSKSGSEKENEKEIEKTEIQKDESEEKDLKTSKNEEENEIENEKEKENTKKKVTDDPETLLKKLETIKQFACAIIFDKKGKVIASTVKTKSKEIKAYLTAFDSYDVTVGNGFVLNGLHYIVYRFYDTLIYGRNGKAGEGPGICLHKFTRTSDEKELFALITYKYPVLSSRAIPILQKFCKEL